eukprot:CAMPEP_0201560620 /NCGR_PEP_ID=MMETSP0173_2-20130828/78364_1 /ASSEMBLY_ACC=CAM_ASM_000268 /TAXON_ID=218659 /ORGANISM="Vexillifera sp., Strain DIVA3 564/2" /LENGTH=1200 /DNA_ID=CAMNT_0047975077 /DNA_START=28 /DNA_END=3628 /DNA_ORIENTATION=+
MSNANRWAKPKNLLRRGEELIKVGRKQEASAVLHEVLATKRHFAKDKDNHPTFELVADKYITLCVELREAKRAKDGLHQYKTICNQMGSAVPFGKIMTHFIELSEARLEKAKREKETKLSQVVGPTKLAAEHRLSSVLENVTGESFDDRVERQVVSPWIKFLWETYRTVLDLLRNNGKLESLYHDTAKHACEFCVKHNRKVEFRRLAEMTRKHLEYLRRSQGSVTTTGAQSAIVDLDNMDTIMMHLQTRYLQLKTATQIGLWGEAFRSIENINEIIEGDMATVQVDPATASTNKKLFGDSPISSITGRFLPADRSPPVTFLLKFTKKIAEVFFAADNSLFHAYTWFRYFELFQKYRDYAQTVQGDATHGAVASSSNAPMASTPIDDQIASSVDDDKKYRRVLTKLFLAILSTPIHSSASQSLADRSSHVSNKSMFDFDVIEERNADLANMLGFSITPKRATLLNAFVAKGLMKHIDPDIAKLYRILEVDFHPLDICEKALPVFCKISSLGAVYSMYLPGLEKMLLTRFLQQVSKVYSRLELSQLKSFAFYFDFDRLEKIIVETNRRNFLDIRIDHAQGIIYFDSALLDSDQLRAQLNSLSANLHQATKLIYPDRAQHQQASKQQLFNSIAASLDEEHQRTLKRNAIIEKRKAEKAQAAKRKEEERIAAEQKLHEEEEQKRRQEDAARAAALEQKRLEAKKIQQKVAQIQATSKDIMPGMAVDADALDPVTKSANERRAVLVKLREDKERLEAVYKKCTIDLDHLERALREEERPLLVAKHETQTARDKEAYKKEVEKMLRKDKIAHKFRLEEKSRLARIRPQRDQFADQVIVLRKKQLEERAERQKRRRAYLQERKEAALERQKKEQEERERKQRERKERERKEREEREERERKQLEARKQREREQRERQEKLDRIAEKQREREQAAMRKQQQHYQSPPPSSGRPGAYKPPVGRWSNRNKSRSPTPPSGGGGGWRSRGSSGGGANDRRRGYDDDDEEVMMIDEEVMMIDEEVMMIDEEVMMIDEEVMMIDEEVMMIDEEVMMIDEEVMMIDEEVMMIDEEVMMIDEEVMMIDEEVMMIDEEVMMIDEGVILVVEVMMIDKEVTTVVEVMMIDEEVTTVVEIMVIVDVVAVGAHVVAVILVVEVMMIDEEVMIVVEVANGEVLQVVHLQHKNKVVVNGKQSNVNFTELILIFSLIKKNSQC